MSAPGCIEYRKVVSTARWRQILTSLSIRWQCSDVIGGHSEKKLTGFETTIVITRTILKLNSWDFLMTSTILLLKFMSSNNSLRVTVLSLGRSKDGNNRFVINEMCKLINFKSLIFRFRHRNLMLSLNYAMLK